MITLRRGVRCNQKVTKSNQIASDIKKPRTVVFTTNSGLHLSGEGGI